MKLWILRHGEAEPRKTTDQDRALTARGQREAEAAGRCLARHAGSALVVMASPYRRAQQTALAVLQELRHPPSELLTVPWCTPEDYPADALDHLSRREEAEFVLVSHMPFVSSLVGLLVHGDAHLGPPMHTASVAELDVPIVAVGTAQLLSLRHPPEFRKAHP